MNNLSDGMDFIDKGIEVHNFFMEMEKQRIINEIQWINLNFNNISNLRNYFLSLAKFNNNFQVAQYANQLNLYSADKIQNMALYRANFLYSSLQRCDNNKIDNKPLKWIVQTLKLNNN